MSQRFSSTLTIFLAAVCFATAFVPAVGLVLKRDPVGRWLFTAVWLFMGLVWLVQFLRIRRSASRGRPPTSAVDGPNSESSHGER